MIAMRWTILVLVYGVLNACKTEAAPDRLRYAFGVTEDWPVIFFLTDSNLELPNVAPLGTVRRSGWDTRHGSVLRQLGPDAAKSGELYIDVLWYEVGTKRSYKARIEFDPASLELDPIRPDAGTLILRAGSSGYIEAVTYKNTYPPSAPLSNAILLDKVCGEQSEISDPAHLAALEYIFSQPISREAFSPRADISELPVNCPIESQ